tara:strand:+ start:444 stop:656 length:213 start_codon:yes stop_codon:yes gene_type:complete
MSTTYRISMVGAYLANGMEFAKAVFPQINGEDMTMDSSCVLVTFDSPQTPVDLGPLVKVEVFDPNASHLK